MNIESLKAKLAEAEFAELTAYVTTLQNQKEEARQESINGRKALKAEVEKLRGIKDTLFSKLDIDGDDVDLDSIQIPTKDSAIEVSKQFERKVKQLEAALKESKDSYSQLDSKFRNTTLDSMLSKAIAAHDFVDADLVREFAKGRVKYEGDEVVFMDNDKALSVEEGLQVLAKTKPHLLKVQGNGGSGYNPTSNSGKAKSFKEMTLQERSELFKTDQNAYNALKSAA